MSENLTLWKQVEKTDPAHTKPITGKAYKGNSPKPHYIVLKATEAFGPCGIGWGFEIVEEKLLDGALLAPGFYERIHMARVRVWYEWNGRRGSVEHVGQTVFSGRRKDGNPFTDEDAPKKSVTDGLIKALSMVGFAGDIFLGRYDDSKYVNELRQEISEQERTSREPERETRTTPPALVAKTVDELIGAIEAAKTEAGLSAITNTEGNIALYEQADEAEQSRIMSAVAAKRQSFGNTRARQ
jgi:hypothetical protein